MRGIVVLVLLVIMFGFTIIVDAGEKQKKKPTKEMKKKETVTKKKENKERNGVYKENYPDGSWVEDNYKKGKLDGISKTYDKDGNLSIEASYKDDKRNGITKIYENGNLIQEVNYVDWKIVGQKSYDKNGNLKTDIEYENGKVVRINGEDVSNMGEYEKVDFLDIYAVPEDYLYKKVKVEGIIFDYDRNIGAMNFVGSNDLSKIVFVDIRSLESDKKKALARISMSNPKAAIVCGSIVKSSSLGYAIKADKVLFF